MDYRPESPTERRESGRERERSPPRSDAGDASGGSITKMIVLGVGWNTSDETFRDYWSQYGDLAECELAKDREGKSRGFGFIHFKAKSVNSLVLQKPHTLDGRRLDLKLRENRPMRRDFGGSAPPPVSLSQPVRSSYDRPAPGPSKRLFLSRLSPDTYEADLREYFSQYGVITDVYMPLNRETRERKGCAFVDFEEVSAAQEALAVPHTIKDVTISVDVAEPRKTEFAPRRGGGREDRGGFGGAPAGGGAGFGMHSSPYDMFSAQNNYQLLQQLERQRLENIQLLRIARPFMDQHYAGYPATTTYPATTPQYPGYMWPDQAQAEYQPTAYTPAAEYAYQAAPAYPPNPNPNPTYAPAPASYYTYQDPRVTQVSAYPPVQNTAPAPRPTYSTGGRCTVVVDNLPLGTQWPEIKDFFRSCGCVTRAEVTADATGKPRGVAVFSTPEEAAAACQLDGTQMKDKLVQIFLEDIPLPPA